MTRISERRLAIDTSMSSGSSEVHLARWWRLGAGLVLGAALSFLMPPIALAGGVILAGVCLVTAVRSRVGRALALFTSGYLLAILAYGALAALAALTGDPSSGSGQSGLG
ncbi:MAG: hypothetical protein ABJA86_08615 [Nocardioidaceae bacterium]